MYSNSFAFAAPTTAGVGVVALSDPTATGWTIVGAFALLTMGGSVLRLLHRPTKATAQA